MVVKDGTRRCGIGWVYLHMLNDGSVKITPAPIGVCAMVKDVAYAVSSWLPGGKLIDVPFSFKVGATTCTVAGVEYDNGWFVVTSADRNALSAGKSVKLYPVY